jgi:hypothetical protein
MHGIAVISIVRVPERRPHKLNPWYKDFPKPSGSVDTAIESTVPFSSFLDDSMRYLRHVEMIYFSAVDDTNAMAKYRRVW